VVAKELAQLNQRSNWQGLQYRLFGALALTEQVHGIRSDAYHCLSRYIVCAWNSLRFFGQWIS
jgi:hypothetical protein